MRAATVVQVLKDLFYVLLHVLFYLWSLLKAQYTPPTPAELQLVGDSLDESEKICQQRTDLRIVGSVNAPVGSRDTVYNFLCCWAIEVGDKWRHNDVIVKKVINTDQNSCSQIAMESVWSVSKLSTKSVSSRRELVASLTRQRRRCVFGLTQWDIPYV